jgi:hypothetical protein
MSSASPPYPWFSGITYNPSFFPSSSSTGDLTKAQANALYLQKTIPDTATALETFTGGIKTPSLDSLTSTTNLIIGANSGALTISKPLSVSYNPLLFLASNIGYRFAPTLSSTSATTNSTILTASDWVNFPLPYGCWLFNLNFYVNSGVSLSRIEYTLTPTSLATNVETRGGGGNIGAGQGSIINGSGTIVNGAFSPTQTWYITGLCSSASISLTSITLILTRIA